MKIKTHPKACLGDQALIMNKDKLLLVNLVPRQKERTTMLLESQISSCKCAILVVLWCCLRMSFKMTHHLRFMCPPTCLSVTLGTLRRRKPHDLRTQVLSSLFVPCMYDELSCWEKGLTMVT